MIAILFVGVKCRVGNFPLPCDALQTVRMHQAIASASAVSKFDSTFGLLEGETFVLRPSQEQAPKLWNDLLWEKAYKQTSKRSRRPQKKCKQTSSNQWINQTNKIHANTAAQNMKIIQQWKETHKHNALEKKQTTLKKTCIPTFKKQQEHTNNASNKTHANKKQKKHIKYQHNRFERNANTASEQLQTEVEKHTNNRLQNPMHTKIKRHMQKMLAENKKGIVSGKQKSEKRKKTEWFQTGMQNKNKKTCKLCFGGKASKKLLGEQKNMQRMPKNMQTMLANKHANNASNRPAKKNHVW